MKNIAFLLLFCCLKQTTTQAQIEKPLTIIEKSILYNEQRVQLSMEYLKERHNIEATTATITPTCIVLHYTAGGTIASNFKYFNNIEIENARKINKDQSKLNVSAHYLIDRDGTVYHLIPDTLFARHTIGLNYCAIGIENIGSKTAPLTQAQVIANTQLVTRLCKKYAIKYVIGHSEYTKFRNSPIWKETNKNYITYKEDPGKPFLIDVRKRLKDLQVRSEP
jgi:N-acetylmuramoyl-L-alanine amidase